MKMHANGNFYHEFMVEGIAYEALFSGNEFYLRIVVEKCRHSHSIARLHDPSYGWYHDDDPIRYVDLTTANKKPIKVMREMDRFICKVLAAKPPWFFTFAANEPNKIRLYRRYAHRLAKRFNYYLVEEEAPRDAATFLFYRNMHSLKQAG